MLANLERIRHQSDRSRIEDHIVIGLTQDIHHIGKVLTRQQLRGVGGHRTSQEQVEVVVDARLLDLALHRQGGDLVHGQQRRHALETVGDTEETAKGGFTDIETAEDDLLAEEGERHRQVGRIERLSLARGAGGEEDHLLVALEHELDIGTHGAEDLVDLVVLVGLHHDARLLLHIVGSHGHVGNDGQVGEACHILVTLDLITEEGDEEDERQGHAHAQEQGCQEDDHLLGADLTTVEGIVDEFAVVSRSRKGDAVLLTFLQEEHIEGGLHILLATHLSQDTFLNRGGRDTALELGEL